jgi:hypothetical protein
VLHLRPGGPAEFRGPPPAAFLWLALEREDEVGPSDLHLAGAFLEEALGHRRRVLLHSSRGRQRTRWAYAALLIRSGRSVGAALRAVEARPWLAPFETDRAMWDAFALSFAPASGAARAGRNA